MTATETTGIAALARADLLLLAARLLGRPSHDDLPDDEAVASLVRAADIPEPEALVEILAAALAEMRSTDLEEWRAEHTRLFQAGVICPTNETAYVRRDKGAIIADICGFYRAFGFESVATTGEKPDHVLCEFEFMAVLLILLGQAQQGGDDESAEITWDALHAFTAEHPAEWVPLCCQRLSQTSGMSVLLAAAAAVEQVWEALIAALGVEVTVPADMVPLEAPIDPEDDETPYECGMAEQDAAQFTEITVDSSRSVETP